MKDEWRTACLMLTAKDAAARSNCVAWQPRGFEFGPAISCHLARRRPNGYCISLAVWRSNACACRILQARGRLGKLWNGRELQLGHCLYHRAPLQWETRGDVRRREIGYRKPWMPVRSVNGRMAVVGTE